MKIDNMSAINLAKNPIAHGRSKHIEMRFHYLRDQVADGKNHDEGSAGQSIQKTKNHDEYRLFRHNELGGC